MCPPGKTRTEDMFSPIKLKQRCLPGGHLFASSHKTGFYGRAPSQRKRGHTFILNSNLPLTMSRMGDECREWASARVEELRRGGSGVSDSGNKDLPRPSRSTHHRGTDHASITHSHLSFHTTISHVFSNDTRAAAEYGALPPGPSPSTPSRGCGRGSASGSVT